MDLFGVATSLLLCVLISALHAERFRETERVSIAQADFALNLLRNAGVESKSLVLSPFSVGMALAIPYIGAAGKTKEEMNQILGKGANDEELHSFFTKQFQNISHNSEYELRIANRLYVHSALQLKDTFVSAAQAKYSGQVKVADFKEASSVSQEVNQWVEEVTEHKIKNLVSSKDISADTGLLIANALYFKGKWENKFSMCKPELQTFFSADGQQREVKMMTQEEHFWFAQDSDVQVLGMPYKGKEVKMFIFLPVERFGLQKFLNKMTGEQLLRYITKIFYERVEVKMPKFKLETEFELSKPLTDMGIKDAFEGSSNFSGMSNFPLHISQVKHKAFVEVDEEGTEAAAATVLRFDVVFALPPVEPIQFIADHPFAFAIVKDHSVLFFGKYV